MRAVLAVLLLGAPFLAGCVQPAPGGMGAQATGELVAALRLAQAPPLDGAGVAAWLASFVETHSPRVTGTPGEKAAGEDLAAQMRRFGYDVRVLSFTVRGLPAPDGPLRVVVAEKPGMTRPEDVILLGAHYDTSVAGVTLDGAYDNGSGTAMVVEMARLFADVGTQETLRFVLFNGEEEGLLASGAYADALLRSGERVHAYVGFDMVGINWPSAAGCLCIHAGAQHAAALNPLQEAVAFDLLAYPRGDALVQVIDDHDGRSSDEASFQRMGFPTMRWAGLASPGAYWGYHKVNDTMETMRAQAGGEDALHRGIEAAAATSYYTVLALDRTPLWATDG